jgi:ferritin-like protein
MSDEARFTRAQALEAALLGAGGLAVGGVIIAGLPDSADSRPTAKQDAAILNFALLMEHVQGGLYHAALRRRILSGELRRYTEVVGGHERAHAAFLRRALGGAAHKPPKLDFGDDLADARRFGLAAERLEDLGVAAYNAQAPNLTRDTLAQAAKIVSVEARHAAWIRDLRGENPAPFATEPPTTAPRVVKALRRQGYVR